MGIHRCIKAAFCTLALAFSSAHAGLVIWDLNPTNTNGSVGSSAHIFTSSGYSITAYGFDRVAGPDPGHELWFKNDIDDHGLGVTGTPHNELQVGPDGPLQYIQFDLGSILSAGFMMACFASAVSIPVKRLIFTVQTLWAVSGLRSVSAAALTATLTTTISSTFRISAAIDTFPSSRQLTTYCRGP